MSLTRITLAGRAAQVRLGLWPVANDNRMGRRCVAVDLLSLT